MVVPGQSIPDTVQPDYDTNGTDDTVNTANISTDRDLPWADITSDQELRLLRSRRRARRDCGISVLSKAMAEMSFERANKMSETFVIAEPFARVANM